MKVIIAGGRTFSNYELMREENLKIFRELKKEGFNTGREVVTIVSGTANGADKLGEKFSKEFSLGLERFPANWNKYGKMAGYIRNSQMANYAKRDDELGVLIAFWDKESRGTKHMIDLAKKNMLRVFIVNY